jgi:hypothetical protein
VLGCTAAFQVRHVRFFRWPVLVQGSTNKVGAVRELRAWCTYVHWLRLLALDRVAWWGLCTLTLRSLEHLESVLAAFQGTNRRLGNGAVVLRSKIANVVEGCSCSRTPRSPPVVVRPCIALVVRYCETFLVICLETLVCNIAVRITVVVFIVIVIVIVVLIIRCIILVIFIILQSLFFYLLYQLTEVIFDSEGVSYSESVSVTCNLLCPFLNFLF